jgi:hypothetical protein
MKTEKPQAEGIRQGLQEAWLLLDKGRGYAELQGWTACQ